MKRTVYFFLLLLSAGAWAQPSKNLALLGSLQFPGQTVAGCWHYNQPGGGEYALVGTADGISVVDITNPAAPGLLFQLPGASSLWHEVKVLGDYAYAVSEGSDSNGVNNGLQIIDLRYLPDSAPNKFYQGDGLIANQLTTAHTVTADRNFVYVNGHNIFSFGRGVLILDVSDPWFPVFRGAITNRYCHDSYVRGDTIFTSDILDGLFSIYDISLPASPVLLATQVTTGQFNHNAWLSDNGRTLFTTDERNGVPLASYEVSDFNNITLLDTFYNGYFSANEVHNVRVKEDFLVNPSYGSQLTLVDAARPANLIEVANYTTGSSLCWDADPYLNSGNIIATDMNSGTLYIFSPTYVRACYLEGLVTDSVTGFPLNAVAVEIISAAVSRNTNGLGEYRTGYADSGTYVVQFSKVGYVTKQIPVNLQNGQLTVLDVALAPIGAGVQGVEAEGISVFPNPSPGRFRIVSGQRPIEGWTVTDANGKTRIHREAVTLMALKEIQIDLRDLPAGVYYLEVKTPDGNFVKPLMKY
jgi:choice-of-anchor B domain-containing protein